MHSLRGVRPHEYTCPRHLTEEADSRSQSRSCPELPARPHVCDKASPPGAAGGLPPCKTVACDQGQGRKSGTSLLTNRRFPSEGPAPPNCLCGSISALQPDNPHSAVELLRPVCAA